MKKIAACVLGVLLLAVTAVNCTEACTSFILKTKDDSAVYGRTLEWGAFDFHSGLVMVPRNLTHTSALGGGRDGMTWKNKYGFVAINGLDQPLYFDGMNETGLIMGSLFFPGFAGFQSILPGKEPSTINNLDIVSYILGQFKTVGEIKRSLPRMRVVINKDIEKEFGAPALLHYVVVDSSGNSIVIEYMRGQLTIHDNKVGVMTNSPPYDWHINNLRNYVNLSPYAKSVGTKEVSGINYTSFGAGAGMTGVPGDYTPPSRFVRAFLFTQTTVASQLKDADTAVNQASRILDNFDIPKGFVREGKGPHSYELGYTQWSVIGDIKNKRYYWWTEWNRQMRMVDLSRMNFSGDTIVSIPLDKTRIENIDNRTNAFQSNRWTLRIQSSISLSRNRKGDPFLLLPALGPNPN